MDELFYIIGAVIALIWSYLVVSRLHSIVEGNQKIHERLMECSTWLADLNKKLSKLIPTPPPAPDPNLSSCNCSQCGKAFNFERKKFNPLNPQVVLCPFCGKQTQLYV